VLITDQQYEDFLKNFTLDRLKDPDTTLGHSFLNYFSELRSNLWKSDRYKLVIKMDKETDAVKAQSMIDLLRESTHEQESLRQQQALECKKQIRARALARLTEEEKEALGLKKK
jgi:hypothetical protein